MAQAGASYTRIGAVLGGAGAEAARRRRSPICAATSRCAHVVVTLRRQGRAEGRLAVACRPARRTAVIGPTAAGKTQLLYLLTGLLAPTSGTRRIRRPQHRRLRQDDAAPAGRLRVPGRDDVQPDAAGEHRLQQDREGRGPREGDRDGGAEGLHRRRCRKGSTRSCRSAAPACRAARSSASCWRGRWRSIRACCCSTTSRRASTPRTERKILENVRRNYPGHDAAVGDAEDRAGRRLRPDRAADGGRGAGLRHPPAAAGDLSRNTCRSMTPSEAPATTNPTGLAAAQGAPARRVGRCGAQAARAAAWPTSGGSVVVGVRRDDRRRRSRRCSAPVIIGRTVDIYIRNREFRRRAALGGDAAAGLPRRAWSRPTCRRSRWARVGRYVLFNLRNALFTKLQAAAARLLQPEQGRRSDLAHQQRHRQAQSVLLAGAGAAGRPTCS